MKNTVKNITIIAQDIGADNHGTGNRITAFDIIIDSSWSEDQIMVALRDIAKEYCLTEDGKTHMMEIAAISTSVISLYTFQPKCSSSTEYSQNSAQTRRMQSA